MSKELKRKETQIDKAKEQMRNIIDKKVGFGRNIDDFDYKRYENSIDLANKLSFDKTEKDGGIYKYIPEREFMDLQKKGFEDNHTELIYENEVLRAWIVRLQSELNNYMAYAIDRLREFDIDTKILNHLAFDKFKMIKFKSMQLELPHKINGDKIKNIWVENIERFKDFLSAYLNPSDIYCILAKVNKDLDYDNQILSFDDLSFVINQWKNIKIK